MVRVRERSALVLVGTALVAAAVGAVALASGSVDAVLFLAPGMLLLALLVLGFYPGEETLAGALTRWVAPLRAATTAGRARRGVHAVPRGGRLVAGRLAGRAPPRQGILT